MEETVLVDDSRGCFGLLVVSHHNVGTLDADLALAVCIGLEDSDFLANDGKTDASVLLPLVSVAGNKGRALGDAVAVENGDTDGVKEIDNILIESRTAADDHLELAAECFVNLCEDRAALVDADLAESRGELHTRLQLLVDAVLLCRCPDAAVESFDKERNENKVGGLLFLELVEKVLDARGDIDLTALRIVTDIVDGRTEGVVRGKNIESLGGDVKEVHTLGHIADDIGLREHNALALAGGSRCENDGCKTVGVDLVVIVRIIALGELLAARFDEGCKREIAFLEGIAVHTNVELSFGILLEIIELARDLCTIEDGIAGRALDGCREVGGGHFLVKRNGDGTDSHQREIGIDPSAGGTADDGNLLVAQTEGDLLCSEIADVVLCLQIGNALRFLVAGVLFIGNGGSVGEVFSRLLDHYAEIAEYCGFIKRICFLSVHYDSSGGIFL